MMYGHESENGSVNVYLHVSINSIIKDTSCICIIDGESSTG